MFKHTLVMTLSVATLAQAATPMPATLDEAATLSREALVALPEIKFVLGTPATEKQLEGKSLVELRLMRNSIYAQYGVPFRARWLREYFEGRAWYKPSAKAAKAVAPVDVENGKLILKKEEALGGEARRAVLPLDMIAVMSPEQLAALPDFKLPLGVAVDTKTLADRPLMELKLLRNSIFAQYGKADFNTPWLMAYFAARPWFKAKDPMGKVAKLDAANADALKKLEDAQAPKGNAATVDVLNAGYCEKGQDDARQRLVFQTEGKLTVFEEEVSVYGKELVDSAGEWQLGKAGLQIRVKSRWENKFSDWKKLKLDAAAHRCM